MKEKKRLKTSYVLVSLGYVILGAVFLLRPELSLNVVCYALGTLVIVYGIVHLITYFVKDRLESAFRYDMVIGIVAVALGIFILICPQLVASVLPFLIGIFILLSSIMKVQNAVDMKRTEHPRWWLFLVFALISAALGVTLIMNPFGSAAVLMMFVGASLLADGVMSLWSMLGLALSLRKVKKAMKALEERAKIERVEGEVIVETEELPEEESEISEETAPASEEAATTEIIPTSAPAEEEAPAKGMLSVFKNALTKKN